jgi:hypothetical protein
VGYLGQEAIGQDTACEAVAIGGIERWMYSCGDQLQMGMEVMSLAVICDRVVIIQSVARGQTGEARRVKLRRRLNQL